MKTLEELIAGLPTSKPVYVLHSIYESHVEFRLKDQQLSTMMEYADPLEALVVSHHGERYDKVKRRFVITTSAAYVHECALRRIVDFYLQHVRVKCPKQSKTYKWLTRAPVQRYNAPFAYGFHEIYRYIFANGLEDETEPNPHVTNVIEILDLMRKKHGEKE